MEISTELVCVRVCATTPHRSTTGQGSHLRPHPNQWHSQAFTANPKFCCAPKLGIRCGKAQRGAKEAFVNPRSLQGRDALWLASAGRHSKQELGTLGQTGSRPPEDEVNPGETALCRLRHSQNSLTP